MKIITSKIAFLLLISFGCIYQVSAQSANKVRQQDYYDFVNAIFAADSTMPINLAGAPELRRLQEDTSVVFKETTYFTADDIDFMKQQLKENKKVKWKSNKLKGAQVISNKKIKRYFKNNLNDGWQKFREKYNGGYSRMSIPIFSRDMNTCFIYISRHCGSLCGSGSLGVYKRVKGKWKRIDTIGTIWMS